MNKDESLADILAPLIEVAEEENQELLEGNHFVLGFAFEYPREVVEDVRKAKMRFCATGGSLVPADKEEPEELEDKFPNGCGFDAPAYGQVLAHDEKLVKKPNGLYKIVKIGEEEKDE